MNLLIIFEIKNEFLKRKNNYIFIGLAHRVSLSKTHFKRRMF